MTRDTFHLTRLFKTPSKLSLNTTRDGASPIFLGNNLFWFLITLTVIVGSFP